MAPGAAKAPVWCRRSQEDPVVVDERPGLFQVVEQGVASILWQR